MFELPEYVTLAKQMDDSLKGKTILSGALGNAPHKFVWYNRRHDEFEKLTKGKTVGEAKARGRWLFVELKKGYVLVLGEFGGKVLFHPSCSEVPKKYHLHLAFADGTFLTATTQMWGAVELYEKGKELTGKYVKSMKTTPIEAGFTFEYFCGLIDGILKEEKKSVKALLTQDQNIPGLGNAIAQDILFKASLHPKHLLDELNNNQTRGLYKAIIDTISEVTRKGGRYDEFDLFGNPGKYIRLMDKNAVNKPCPRCGGKVEKIQYLGGACYFCPACQPLPGK
jgi:formamidopyrimidine-DNA glycosylase